MVRGGNHVATYRSSQAQNTAWPLAVRKTLPNNGSDMNEPSRDIANHTTSGYITDHQGRTPTQPVPEFGTKTSWETFIKSIYEGDSFIMFGYATWAYARRYNGYTHCKLTGLFHPQTYMPEGEKNPSVYGIKPDFLIARIEGQERLKTIQRSWWYYNGAIGTYSA